MIVFSLLFSFLFAMDPAPNHAPHLLTKELLDESKPSDWRYVDQKNLLYLETEKGLVLIELMELMAPNHYLNIKQLAENKFWDNIRFARSQDNYVVQWGVSNPKKMKNVKPRLKGEYFTENLPKKLLTPLEDKDTYAPFVGFFKGFPMGYHDDKTWMLHCYGALGVGRDEAFDSGSGTELYVVTGHSPRHLDLNITLVGKVRLGMELLSTLPRGKGPLGFYKDKKKGAKIKSIRVGTQLPKKKQLRLQVLRTDTDLFRKLIIARKYRQESWFHYRGGRVEVCNVPLPTKIVSK